MKGTYAGWHARRYSVGRSEGGRPGQHPGLDRNKCIQISLGSVHSTGNLASERMPRTAAVPHTAIFSLFNADCLYEHIAVVALACATASASRALGCTLGCGCCCESEIDASRAVLTRDGVYLGWIYSICLYIHLANDTFRLPILICKTYL